MNRRDAVKNALVASLLTAISGVGSPAAAGTGRFFRQGVARGVFGDKMPLEDCCHVARACGIEGFDFIGDPHDWPTLQRFGLTMSMLRVDYGGGVSIGRGPPGTPGWNEIGLKEAQGEFLHATHEAIDAAGREGFPNLIVLAGSRGRVTYEEGADNSVSFLNQVKSHAEDRGVTLCMELLNSKGLQAPPQSLFDHASWGFDVVRRVNSPRVKVLYDIWHAQLMDGDIVRTIRNNIAWIGHFHTGSVPDRHELFREDELDYRFIASEIARLGFKGFVTHEWSPSPGSNVEDDLRKSAALLSI
jgi:hydroxypyruvate isomerase